MTGAIAYLLGFDGSVLAVSIDSSEMLLTSAEYYKQNYDFHSVISLAPNHYSVLFPSIIIITTLNSSAHMMSSDSCESKV